MLTALQSHSVHLQVETHRLAAGLQHRRIRLNEQSLYLRLVPCLGEPLALVRFEPLNDNFSAVLLRVSLGTGPACRPEVALPNELIEINAHANPLRVACSGRPYGSRP